MKTRFAVPVLLLTLLVVPAAPAAAVHWGIGADLGFNVFMPSSDYDDMDNANFFGWPLTGGAGGEVFVPGGSGLRVSFVGENPKHEAWVGTSLSHASVGDNSVQMLGLTANYQFNLETQGEVKPYLTAGAGLGRVSYSHEEGSDYSATNMSFGAGVGIARKLGGGRIRAELRYDQQTEGADADDDGDERVLIHKGGNLAVKLGFDLWAR